MRKIFNTFNGFEEWFNRKFGWFFTNGHKDSAVNKD
jgi:hypothetical protein